MFLYVYSLMESLKHCIVKSDHLLNVIPWKSLMCLKETCLREDVARKIYIIFLSKL